MLKYYTIGEKQYQFEEGSQPAEAVELKKDKPSAESAAPEPAETLEKEKATANKAAPKLANKNRKAGSK